MLLYFFKYLDRLASLTGLSARYGIHKTFKLPLRTSQKFQTLNLKAELISR